MNWVAIYFSFLLCLDCKAQNRQQFFFHLSATLHNRISRWFPKTSILRMKNVAFTCNLIVPRSFVNSPQYR